MRNLVGTKLLGLLSCKQTQEVMEMDLKTAYDEFCVKLMSYCKEETDFVSLLQALGFTRVELLVLQEQKIRGEGKKCLN